jgi:hypothetical protein
VRQKCYGGERGCKIASPLSSNASGAGEGEGWPAGEKRRRRRRGRRGDGGGGTGEEAVLHRRGHHRAATHPRLLLPRREEASRTSGRMLHVRREGGLANTRARQRRWVGREPHSQLRPPRRGRRWKTPRTWRSRCSGWRSRRALRAEMAPSLKLCVDPAPSLHGALAAASVDSLGLGTVVPCGDLRDGDGFGRLPLGIASRCILIWWPELEPRSCNSSSRVAVGAAPMAEEARHARHGSCKCNCLFASVVGDGGKRGEWKVLCTRGKHRFASSKCLSLLDSALRRQQNWNSYARSTPTGYRLSANCEVPYQSVLHSITSNYLPETERRNRANVSTNFGLISFSASVWALFFYSSICFTFSAWAPRNVFMKLNNVQTTVKTKGSNQNCLGNLKVDWHLSEDSVHSDLKHDQKCSLRAKLQEENFSFMTNHQGARTLQKHVDWIFSIKDACLFIFILNMPPTTINVQLAFCGPLSLALHISRIYSL